ncbi:MAG TPA: carbon monoxide dehydrogenase subunit G, partial [Hyphomicrobiaceae bacterium]|nr:carbon monoxide dehydrogenase subunit G [Hyphomicrobiaceae bacterium]
ANRETVWAKLNDPVVLKSCVPGCEQLDKVSETEFQAVASIKVGPVKARWKGKVRLSDLDPPNGYKISGEGEGGVAGFAKGGATVALADKDGGTLLSYNVEAQIGGKLAQLGQRLINSAAKKTADDFFANFAKAVQQG